MGFDVKKAAMSGFRGAVDALPQGVGERLIAASHQGRGRELRGPIAAATFFRRFLALLLVWVLKLDFLRCARVVGGSGAPAFAGCIGGL